MTLLEIRTSTATFPLDSRQSLICRSPMGSLSKWWSQRRTLNFSSTRPSRHRYNEKKAYARARATFFMMRRGLAILLPAIFLLLYLAMKRPHLDYAVQTSFPYLQKDIQLIERMQRLAMGSVKSFRRLPYPVRLHELKLPAMERHFLRATLITVYKLFHVYMNLSAEEFFRTASCW